MADDASDSRDRDRAPAPNGDMAGPSESGADDKDELLPKHTIFLSHSGAEKSFVEQLCVDLETANYYPFFDQRSDSLPIGARFPTLLLEAASKCLVAVVVLSESFLTSKWPVKELITFVEAAKRRNSRLRSNSSLSVNHGASEGVETNKHGTRESNPNYDDLKFVPLFFEITPEKLSNGYPVKFWNALVKKEMEKNHATKFEKLLPHGKGNYLMANHVETPYAKAEKHLNGFNITREKYFEALRMLRAINGLRFEKYEYSQVKYRKAAVNEIMKLVPRQLPVETADIQGYKRLCKAVEDLFREKRGPSGKSVRRCLGLFGKSGLGKSTICCEAMFQHFQDPKNRERTFGGRYCRVKLPEGDVKASESGNGADEPKFSADGKKRQERIKSAIQQLVGLPPKLMSNVMSEFEGREYLTSHLRYIPQPVFLVIDNVSESSRNEASWYANIGLPEGSYVLVTSRSREILEFVLGGSQYCYPFPTLQDDEAMQLFLSNALSRDKLSLDPAFKPTDAEHEVLQTCLWRCCVDGEFIPRLLTRFASFLHTKGDILSWKDYIDKDADRSILELEYDKLDNVSKLVFLDLAIFANEMSFTHMDFHDELDWDEHSNFKLVVQFIAMLHGVPFHVAERKLKGLMNSSLLEESKTRISVSEDYHQFAASVVKRAEGEEKKWCMACTPDTDNNYFEKGMVRVALAGISFDRDEFNLPKWRSVKLLFIDSVRNLPILDLQGLCSLRVLRVKQCPDLEQIVCTCNSSSREGLFCHQKERGCLSELRVVQLEYLSNLKETSFPMHSWKLETLWFFECPNLSHMPDLHYCPKLKRLRLPCGDFKGFQGLKSNLELTELAFYWETHTIRNFTENMRTNLLLDVMNLTNLTVLDIVDERDFYDWIPAGFRLNVGALQLLTFLDLSCATSIQEVEGLEQLSHLTSLGLYGCCELRKLPNLIAKKLKRLCIGHCHKLDMSTQAAGPEVEAFHALGESCAFGEHKCLDPYSPLEDPREDPSHSPPEDIVLASEEEAQWQLAEEELLHWEDSQWVHLEEEDARPILCKQCNESLWQEKYVARDSEESNKKDEEVLAKTIPTAQRQDDTTSCDNVSLNILLLGETGVGKSTFINALCNYLKFPTLDEAQHGEMQSLIYSEFVTSNDDGDERKIVVGTPTEDEGCSNNSVGSSCTQKCKAYKFPIGDKMSIRLVDSPGIGDTRGFDQDVKNIKDYLSFISRYEVLNAICILLKPDQERLTISLRYCILELLAHLHKDASSNILFCFTNSRSTMFRVGGTKRLLTELLSQSPHTAAIKLEKNTMFHFDSEGFRFLACVKSGLEFSDDDTNIFRSSWKRSSDEASRLIQHIASLTPHDIQSTLSLNRVRDMLASIETPLAAISAAIQNNLEENRKVMKELLESSGDITDKYKNLIIKEEFHEMVPLGHLRTLCNSSSCQGRICHDHCSPTETLAGGVLGYFAGDDHIYCEKLSLRKKTCKVCQCPNVAHFRISHERKIMVRQREDESVRKVIDKKSGDIQEMKEISAIYEKREKSYKDEMQVVVNAAALFAGFLEQNSIITYHAATQEYLKDQIKKKKSSDDHNTPAARARIQELESLLETYERQVQNFKNISVTSSGRILTITPADVKEELKSLYALPRNGDSLQILMNDVEREYKWAAIKRRDEVAVNIPRVASTMNQNTNCPQNAESLLEKLAGMDFHTHKKLAHQSKREGSK